MTVIAPGVFSHFISAFKVFSFYFQEGNRFYGVCCERRLMLELSSPVCFSACFQMSWKKRIVCRIHHHHCHAASWQRWQTFEEDIRPAWEIDHCEMASTLVCLHCHRALFPDGVPCNKWFPNLRKITQRAGRRGEASNTGVIFRFGSRGSLKRLLALLLTFFMLQLVLLLLKHSNENLIERREKERRCR